MKKILFLAMAAIAVSAFADRPKYVFLFIGDGMSVPQRMTAEEFSRKSGAGPLAMNDMPFSAMTRTCSADSLVTDSAAAATAIACGTKTKNHYSGVDPEGKPLFSSAAAAKKAGAKVGIVSTVTITHATPAGFYAHRSNRGDAYGISLDLADSGFDFFAGGGLDVNEKNSLKHKQYAEFGDAYAYVRSKGYKIVKTKDQFLALKPGDGKVFTKFTNGALETTIDADGSQPTLAEMVAKAAEMLDGDSGFFIMAEGGRIDWAGHGNDAATNLRDVLALDEAVKVALEFQKSHPDDTLVVVTGDHETGGMSMGFAGTGYALYMDRLANQTMSVGKFGNKVNDAFKANPNLSFDDVKPIITEAFGFKFEGDAKKDPMVLSQTELKGIVAAFEHDVEFHKSKIEENSKYDGEKRYLLGGECRVVMSHKCGIGWSSGSHTAMPVLTTAKGRCAEKFSGFIENTDIAKAMKAFYE
ncbi:MAG: alkaline phosphatase [Kiritimatiellae bacterium]|nr:alkaline phosphatase [Kiritimatiellia bacterium]